MDERLLRIVHLVQTKLEIDRIPMQCDLFEAGADYLHGILEAFRNDTRLQLPQGLDILIDGDQLSCLGGRVKELPACRPDEKYDFASEVVETAEILAQFCVIRCQVGFLFRDCRFAYLDKADVQPISLTRCVLSVIA